MSLARARARAESRMKKQCRVLRKGPRTPDGSGGYARLEQVVYQGRCLIAAPGTQGDDEPSGGQSEGRTATRLYLPHGTDLRSSDVVQEVLPTDTADPATWTGQRYGIAGPVVSADYDVSVRASVIARS